MKVYAFELRPHLHISNLGHHRQPTKLLRPITKLSPSPRSPTTATKTINRRPLQKLYRSVNPPAKNREKDLFEIDSSDELPRWILLGGFSFALALHILGFDGRQEAMAFGPDGPLVEEFWDNLRRYGLYFITVSTGAIYTIVLPIYELLKNPITAILIIIVFVGILYLLSQILSAMVGVSEFSYQYGY